MGFNYGAGIGGFMQGIAQGMTLAQRYKQASKEYDADKVREEAMDAAKAEHEAATEAKTAALMGIGQIGAPQATETPGVTTAAVDIGNPQGAHLAEQAPAGPAVAAPTAAPGTPAGTPGTPTDQPRMVQAKFSPREGLGAPAAPANPANPGEQTTTEMSIGMAPTAARASSAPVTREAAAAQAKKTVPTVLEFFQKSGVPRITEHYLKTGDMEKAQAWQKYAEDSETQRNVRTWAKAYRAVESQDWETAGEHIMDLYGKYDDGVTPVSREVVKDKAGNVTGFNVSLKNDATGETRSQFIGTQDMATLGLQALSPGQMFEATWKQKLAADKAKTDAQAKVGEAKLRVATETAIDNAKQPNRLAMEDREHRNSLERINEKSDADARNQRNKAAQELEAKVDILRKGNYSEDAINAMLPELAGASSYKKATSPEEAKRLAFSDRMKNDPQFSRKSPDEQRKLIEQDMALIFGGSKSPVNTQASAGIGAPSSGNSAKGAPWLDTKTGQVVRR